MPIYEYCCPECGAEQELFVSIPDPALIDAESRPMCDKCNVPMERAPSTAALRFKSGFFKSGGY